MGNTKLVAALLLMLGALAAAPKTHAEVGVPDLDEWIKEAATIEGDFPRRLVFLTAMPEKGQGLPEFLALDARAFNDLGFFQMVDTRNAAWDLKLNASRLAKSPRDSFDLVVELTGADTVVLAPASGEWTFFRKVDKERKVVLRAPPPSSVTPKDVAGWLLSALGWDGVVISQKDDFVLVGSTAAMLGTSDIQALAVADSERKFSLREDERKGSGLLGLATTKGGVGIFDVVLLGQGVSSIPAGTKLIIERKAK